MVSAAVLPTVSVSDTWKETVPGRFGCGRVVALADVVRVDGDGHIEWWWGDSGRRSRPEVRGRKTTSEFGA
jgi:hypothetical protein